MERYFDLYLNAGVSTPLVINCNQYDKSETWIFTLYDETGLPYQPASGSIVGLKADGNTIMNAGTVNSSGQVVIQQTEQMTAVAGKSEFELILDASHGTANFILLVERRPGDNAVPSESDISLIEQAIEAASNITQVVELTNIVNSVRNEMTNFIADNAGLPNETTLSTDEIYRVWQSSATTPTGGKTVLSAKVTDYDVIAVYTTISTLGGNSTTPEAHYFNAQDFAGKITTVVCGTSRDSATSKDMFVPMLSLICDSDEKTITCSSAKLVAWNGTASSDATVTESGSTNVQGSIVRITGIRNDQLDTEVVNARVGADGTTYNTLKARLDAENSDLKSQISQSTGMSAEFKVALENLVSHVAFIGDDPTGQTYIDALHTAMYPPANLSRIGAVYTQGSTVVYDTDSLDSLKGDLVVTAYYDNGTTEIVSTYTLSGTLNVGTSAITVSYGGKTATFNVAVTAKPYEGYGQITLSDVKSNAYIDENGDVQTYSRSYYDTEYFSLEGSADDLIFSSTSGNFRICLYDANKTFIRQVRSRVGTTNNFVWLLKKASTEVYYRLSWGGTNSDTFALYDGTTQNLVMKIGDIDSSTGADKAETKRIRSVDYIPVSGKMNTLNCPFAADWASWASNNCGFFFRCYDSSKNIVGSLLDSSAMFRGNAVNKSLPTNTAFVRIIMQKDNNAMSAGFSEDVINPMVIGTGSYWVTEA